MKPQSVKQKLSKSITRARLHHYIPIAIAEILGYLKGNPDYDIDSDSFRSDWKKWRNEATSTILKRSCSSSDDYQQAVVKRYGHDFPVLLAEDEDSAVQRYIYHRLKRRYAAITNVKGWATSCSDTSLTPDEFFKVIHRSPEISNYVVSTLFEIFVFSVVSLLLEEADAKVSVIHNHKLVNMSPEIANLSALIFGNEEKCGRVIRMGVASAADCGIDMYLNFGPTVQVKNREVKTDDVNDLLTAYPTEAVLFFCRNASKKTQNFARKRGSRIVEQDELTRICLTLLSSSTRADRFRALLLNAIEVELPHADGLQEWMERRKLEEPPASGIWQLD